MRDEGCLMNQLEKEVGVSQTSENLFLTLQETRSLIRSMVREVFHPYILYQECLEFYFYSHFRGKYSTTMFRVSSHAVRYFLRFGSETPKYCSCLYSAILRRIGKALILQTHWWLIRKLEKGVHSVKYHENSALDGTLRSFSIMLPSLGTLGTSKISESKTK